MLEPYVVLDFTDERGEVGAMMLGDLGADVIRVEPPEGSLGRQSGPWQEGVLDDQRSLQFQAFNRNKRSISLSSESAEDQETLRKLSLIHI